MEKCSEIEDRRSRRRSKLLMAATLEHPGGVTPVTLRNLSANGAQVEGDHGLPTGTQIVLRKNELAASGRIAWSAGGRSGIAFAYPLDPEIVLRHIPVPKRVPELVHKRPGFRGPLSAEDHSFAERLWGGPLPSVKGGGRP
jgi:hypothetical protein